MITIDWSLYPNFKPAEFRCRHTGKEGMQPAFLEVLQRIRTEYGKPMAITSGYRHPTHPVEAAKGGLSRGEHTRGMCADVRCGDSKQRFSLINIAIKHGIHRIGVHKDFLHLGLGGRGLAANVLWLY